MHTVGARARSDAVLFFVAVVTPPAFLQAYFRKMRLHGSLQPTKPLFSDRQVSALEVAAMDEGLLYAARPAAKSASWPVLASTLNATGPPRVTLSLR